MRTSLDCISCFVRQALEAARFVTDDPIIHERVVRNVLRSAVAMDLTQSPPAVAQQIHRQLREMTGVDDAYGAVKDRFNRMALNMLAELAMQVQKAADPLTMAIRLAIAGNVIDLGANGSITEDQTRQAIAASMDEPCHGNMDAFRKAVSGAASILYLTDNAGEIVFDQLLIRQLPRGRVTVAVRGQPVLNDATITDAEAAGLCEIADVIDNGSDAPGTILSECSDSFRQRFAKADLIIAKGQGNVETLSNQPENIYFLFKVKCPVIAAHVGLPVGTHVLRHSACTSSLQVSSIQEHT